MVKFFKIDYWIKKLERYKLISNEKRMVKMARERKKNVFQRAYEKYLENMNSLYIVKLREDMQNLVSWLDYFPLIKDKKLKKKEVFRIYHDYRVKKIQVEIRIKEVKEKNERK